MGRPRIHANKAAKQKAWRDKHRKPATPKPLVVQVPFVIAAPDGTPACEVTMGENGPVLRLFGEDGRKLVELEAHRDGGGVYTLSPEGKAAAQIYAERSTGKLALTNEQGQEALELPLAG